MTWLWAALLYACAVGVVEAVRVLAARARSRRVTMSAAETRAKWEARKRLEGFACWRRFMRPAPSHGSRDD